jgi:hypothetical protein
VRMAEDRWGGHHRGRAGGSGVMLRDTMIKTFMDVRTGGSGGSGLSVMRIKADLERSGMACRIEGQSIRL